MPSLVNTLIIDIIASVASERFLIVCFCTLKKHIVLDIVLTVMVCFLQVFAPSYSLDPLVDQKDKGIVTQIVDRHMQCINFGVLSKLDLSL